jgi:hypothetical protein
MQIMPENKNLSGLQELHMHNGILQQGLMEFYQFENIEIWTAFPWHFLYVQFFTTAAAWL